MKEKNKKLFKIIWYTIFAILTFYLIFVLIRWNELNNLSKMNNFNKEQSNYYISVTTQSMNDENISNTYKYWKKDNVYKCELESSLNEHTSHTFWYNANNNEKHRYSLVDDAKYVLLDTSKVESMVNMSSSLFNLPILLAEDEGFKRFTYALNPSNSMKKEMYDGTKCYVFETQDGYKNSDKLYIAIDSGLLVYKESIITSIDFEGESIKEETAQKHKSIIKYSFGGVNDDALALPDFSDYEIKDFD